MGPAQGVHLGATEAGARPRGASGFCPVSHSPQPGWVGILGFPALAKPQSDERQPEETCGPPSHRDVDLELNNH